jgi:hypothetical protein
MLANQTQSTDKAPAQARAPQPRAQAFLTPAEQAQPADVVRRAQRDVGSLRPRDVLQLQRMVGNRAVGSLLSGSGRCAPIQAKRGADSARDTDKAGDEEQIQLKADADKIQLKAGADIVARGAGVEGREAGEGSVGPLQRKTNENGLPPGLQAGIENLSGISLDDVTVRYASPAPAQVHALAYTRGTDIHVGPGQEKHLAHEAWHVVQQKQGRVRPTMQMAGAAINDDPALEQEADVMGAQASQATHSTPTAQTTSRSQAVEGGQASVSSGTARASGSGSAVGVAQHFAQTRVDVLQRARLGKVALFDKTLGEFEQHTKYEQLDWANLATITADERTLIWTLLDKIVDKGLDGVKISKFVADIGTDNAKLGKLLVYSAARVGKYKGASTVTLGAAADLDEALKWGKWVGKLSDALTGPLVKAVIPEEVFQYLIEDEAIAQRFLDYVAACKPVLETPEGAEATAFVKFDKEGGKYTDYNVDLPEVRNYHKFKKAALDQVKINKADTTKTKPLTLVLHSFFDHNGAFHRHSRVTEVLTNVNILSLLYENLAQPKLDALKGGGLEALAKKYGKDDKITQVMLAGHGNYNLINMGGGSIEVTDDKAVEKDKQYLLLDPNYAQFAQTVKFWDEFFKELNKHLGAFDHAGKHFEPTVLLRACLTNSNSVENKTIKDRIRAKHNVDLDNPLVDAKTHQDKIKQEVVDYINERGSLTAQIQSKYSKGAFKVLGANASISSSSVGAVKPTGELGFVSLSDPKVGGEKLEYVEEGHEPLGVMRAVVQSWATDEGACKLAMARRLLVPAANWEDRLILLLFALATNQLKDDLLKVNLLTTTSSNLYHVIGVDADRRVAKFDNDTMMATYRLELIGGMLLAPDLPEPKKVKLVLYEYWMLQDAPKSKEFLESLGDAYFNRATAKDYVDFKKIGPTVSFLMDNADGSAAGGKRLLAVLDLLHGTKHAKSIKLIKDAATGNGGKLPANITSLLGGETENNLLQAVGLPPSVVVPVPIGIGAVLPPAKVNNVDTDGDGTNDAYVVPMTPTLKKYTGLQIFGRAKRVREAPRDNANILADKYEVLVVGEVKDVLTDVSKDWYAVRIDGKLGYVQTRNLENV